MSVTASSSPIVASAPSFERHPDPAQSRRNWYVSPALWLALGLIAAVVWLAPSYWRYLHASDFGALHDDTVYTVTAKALAEGKGYRIISQPQAPPQTKYPILFPWLLSLVWRADGAFPSNLFWLRLVPLASALVWFWMIWVLVREQTGQRLAAALVVLAIAASPWTVFLSTNVMSDIPFAALATAAIVAFDRAQKNARSADGWVIGAAVLAAAAYHTRSIGIVLIAAGVVALLVHRKWRAVILFGAVSGLAILPWLFWQWTNARHVDPYLSHANYYKASNLLANYGWDEKLKIAGFNLCYLLFSPLSSTGLRLQYNLAELILSVFLAGVMLAGLRRSCTSLAMRLYLVFTLLLLIIWVFPPQRFLVPVSPLFLIAVWHGLPARVRAVAFTAIILCFAAVEGMQLQEGKHSLATHGYAFPWPQSYWPDAQTIQYSQQQLAWIRRSLPPQAVLFGFTDPLYFLATGHPAVRGLTPDLAEEYYSTADSRQPYGSPAALAQHIKRIGADYVVCTQFPPGIDDADRFNKLLHQLVVQSPAAFTRVSRTAPGFEVYKVSPEHL